MTLLAFLNPLFLWGAAALLVPLIIHLINRRRYRTVTWAAMEFLLQAYKKKNRRMRLENLLLLLLRCAIPVVLALALARPFFGSDHPLSLIAQNRREVVMVVDESYSMNRRVSGGTLFQTARAQVQRVVDALSFESGDTCTLMTLAKEPRILVQRSTSPADLERALQRLSRPTFEAADLRRTMDLLENDVLPEIPGEREVYWLSDFQKVSFEEPLQEEAGVGDAAGQTLQQRLRRMTSEGVYLHLVNLADTAPPVENASVVDLRASEPFAITQQSIRLIATVQRRGGTATSTSGRFQIGERDHPVTVNFDQDGQATVETYHAFVDAGDQSVEFFLDEDDLVDDNARYLRMLVRRSIPVLVVDGDPGGVDELEGEVGNLLLVLDPLFGELEAEGLRRHFEPEWISHHEFNRGKVRLDQYRALLLANVREIEEVRMVQELENYVHRGGGVWFFLGDQIRPESYNQRLYKADGTGLLPLPLAEQPRGEVPTNTLTGDWTEGWFRMQIEDDLHPMVRTFIDDRRRNFLGSPVFRFWPLEGLEEGPAEMRLVLSFRDPLEAERRYPALLDHSLGRGHVAWFTSTADTDWSLFAATTAAFFPLVWDVTTYLSTPDASRHHLGIGDAIQKSVPAAPLPYTITLPSGEVRPITDLPREPLLGHFPLRPFADTTLPGIYMLDLPLDADEPPVRELFAVNVDSAEGDLSHLGREELSQLLDRIPFSYETEVTQLAAEEALARQGEIWKTLMTALLILLLAETVLSWRFGVFR